jgi:cytochrome c
MAGASILPYDRPYANSRQMMTAVPRETHRRKLTLILFSSIVISSTAASIPASADLQSIRRGKAFAQANCSQCHSIDRSTRSPRAAAPPFRTLHKQYPVETLEDALGEGLSTGHPRMPEFRLDPGQVGDFISFLKSLE